MFRAICMMNRVMMQMNLEVVEFHRVLYFEHSRRSFASRLALFRVFKENRVMQETHQEEILQDFGKRVQRCFGCFVAFYLKDMYLGEDASFFCEHCKDDTMFHFSEFSQMVDTGKLRENAEDDHHH